MKTTMPTPMATTTATTAPTIVIVFFADSVGDVIFSVSDTFAGLDTLPVDVVCVGDVGIDDVDGIGDVVDIDDVVGIGDVVCVGDVVGTDDVVGIDDVSCWYR